jgi:TolB-like protein/class 3 adenylate cyclase
MKMSDSRPDRHLAAIVVADVVGYTRLIEADEAATLAALKRCREEIIEPLIREFNGRAVKFMGDGALLEFASAVNAVEFSIALQTEMLAANSEDAGKQAILLRIGINLGDIVFDAGDVFGEGVNIAARLETLAEPGRVLISDAVYRQVKGRLGFGFRDLGEQRLKNVSDPVRIYVVEPERGEQFPRAVGNRIGVMDTEKISIAVLPFDNMSGDAEQTYFSDGITEDIISELSRFRELRVIARNNSFQFRDGKHDVREIGRKLDAQFIVDGSIRHSASRIRITAQLIDAVSQAHIWVERYDRQMADVFDIQEEIACMVSTRIAGHARTSAVERARFRPTESFSAYDLLLRARQMNTSYEGGLEAESLLLRAIELDPRYSAAHALLADISTIRFLYTGGREFLDKALTYARQAIALDPEEPWANYAIGFVFMYRRSWPEAGLYLRRAVELNQNDVYFLAIYALWLSYSGRDEEALAAIKEAMRRDPFGQEWFWDIQGIVFTTQEMYVEAISSFKHMASLPPWSRCYLAISLAKSGDQFQAKAVLKDFNALALNIRPSNLIETRMPHMKADTMRRLLGTLQSIEND